MIRHRGRKLALPALAPGQEQGGITGLEEVEFGAGRISVDDKQMINCRADVNQLVPFKYKWAWQKYLDACANHWMPQEINMTADIALWKNPDGLTEDERTIIKRNLGFFHLRGFTGGKQPGAGGIPAHNQPGMPSIPVAAGPLKRPCTPMPTSTVSNPWGWMRPKYLTCIVKFLPYMTRPPGPCGFTQSLGDPAFHTGTAATDQRLLRDLIAFYIVFEGIFFYVGFVQVLSMGRRNKMTGCAEQFQYILRDESMHMNFGIDVINQIKIENPHLWTPEFQQEIITMLREAVELETRYAYDSMPRGVLGLNANMYSEEYLKFIANRRCAQIGLSRAISRGDQPFPLDE